VASEDENTPVASVDDDEGVVEDVNDEKSGIETGKCFADAEGGFEVTWDSKAARESF